MNGEDRLMNAINNNKNLPDLIKNHIRMKSNKFLSNLNNIETCKNSLVFLAMVFLIILTYVGIIWFSDYLNNY